MNKIVSASEFKAKCLRMIEEMQADGVPITITKRGKVVAEVKPKGEEARRSVIGCMKGSFTVEGDIIAPIHPDWEVEWEKKWDDLGFPVIGEPR